MSTDPALGDYIPSAPVNEEARKANGNLPGLGGVYNTVNLHLYHYAGNNPVKYVDPDGRLTLSVVVVSLGVTGLLALTGVVLKNGPFSKRGQEALGNTVDAATEGAKNVGNSIKNAVTNAVDAIKEAVDSAKSDGREGNEDDKKHTSDQQALSDLAKQGKQTGLSNNDADTLLDWGREVDPENAKGLRGRDDRGENHWIGGDHIHVGGQDHIPVN